MGTFIATQYRISLLKARTLAWEETQRFAIGRRLYHALRGLSATNPGTPWMTRKAAILAGIVANMEPEIGEGERIVGYNYYGSDDGMWMEVVLSKRNDSQKEQLLRYLRQGQLSEEQIGFILQKLETIDWEITHPAYVIGRPEEVTLAEEEGLLVAYGTCENHTILGYEKVLRLGFAGIRAEIAARLQALDWSDPQAPAKKLLLESCQMVVEAACDLGRRYAQKAEALLQVCIDPVQAAELEEIRKTVLQVPEFPARTFREAVQALWFAHVVNTWEDGINANSLGRIDQVLYPYYAQDLAAGRLTAEETREILACLWLKLFRDYDVQQATLGGVDREGRDAANDLTYLMLDVTEELDLIRCLGVRLHEGSPDRLLARALEIVRKGKGIPFFFNDNTLVPALVENGVALEDARDYANIGCVETTIPGKANPHAVSNRVNLLKCLELALNNGISLTTGRQIGPQTGEAKAMRSLEDVKAAYHRQVEHFVALACFESNRCELAYRLTHPMPYKSMLTEGCLESGRDFNDGGALYNFHESQAMGIPNVADSLAALQQLVFEQGKYTLGDVVELLKGNFPSETVRREFAYLPPKYGNDIEAVDRLAVWAFDEFCDALKKQKNPRGLGYFAQPFTFLWHVDMGAKTAATPDSRRSGEIMAYSLSPMQGRDHSGLTAVLNSLARLPHHRAAGCTSAIIEIDPELFTRENLPLMVAYLRTAILKGVGQLQFNVVSADTLRQAQREPEKYRNLAVRVSGFSQRFCLLSKELQDHIIARTKHTH
jgi:formate C-acetyltransferase